MSSYTAAQYREQQRITKRAAQANASGLCVVCNLRPQAVWPDGVQRITCGADACYTKWLRFRPEEKGTHENGYT